MIRRRRNQQDDVTLDLTPLIDVVFILLIFFVVTATFATQSGLLISRPAVATTEPQKTVSGVITLDRNSNIWVDGKQVDIAFVRDRAQRWVSAAPRGHVLIEADENAQTGFLIQLVDAVKAAGAQSVAVANQSQVSQGR